MENAFTGLINALSAVLDCKLSIEDGIKAHVDFDGFPLLMRYLPETEQLLLAAPIAETPAEGREALYPALLRAQFLFVETRGAALALDPEEGFVSLQLLKDMTALTQDNFPTLVEGFLNVAEEWSARCRAPAQTGESAGRAGSNAGKTEDAPPEHAMLRI